MSLVQNLRDILYGVAYGRYERELKQQAAELNDYFLLLCYMEVVGLPNPAAFYLLEIYPHLLDQFQELGAFLTGDGLTQLMAQTTDVVSEFGVAPLEARVRDTGRWLGHSANLAAMQIDHDPAHVTAR